MEVKKGFNSFVSFDFHECSTNRLKQNSNWQKLQGLFGVCFMKNNFLAFTEEKLVYSLVFKNTVPIFKSGIL